MPSHPPPGRPSAPAAPAAGTGESGGGVPALIMLWETFPALLTPTRKGCHHQSLTFGCWKVTFIALSWLDLLQLSVSQETCALMSEQTEKVLSWFSVEDILLLKISCWIHLLLPLPVCTGPTHQRCSTESAAAGLPLARHVWCLSFPGWPWANSYCLSTSLPYLWTRDRGGWGGSSTSLPRSSAEKINSLTRHTSICCAMGHVDK